MTLKQKIQKRQQLWDTMTINKFIVSGHTTINVPIAAGKIVQKILDNKQRYLDVAHKFPNPGLKWWLVAVLHSMECSLNFNCYLGNGQPLRIKTTIVPKGRGPFTTFLDGAVDAIELEGLDKITDWSMGNVLYTLEGYNGYGYKSINSPYLWSGTNHYIKGKYVRDGVYDPNYVSDQIGIAVLLKLLLM